MKSDSYIKAKVEVLRHRIDYLNDENYENTNCNENGGNCCAAGYCCNKPHKV